MSEHIQFIQESWKGLVGLFIGFSAAFLEVELIDKVERDRERNRKKDNPVEESDSQ